MARTANLVVGIVAVAAIGGFAMYRRVLHDDKPSAPALPAAPGSAGVREGSANHPDRVVQQPTAAPALPPPSLPEAPRLPNGSAAQTPAEVFAVEARDPAWAPQIEAEIAERFAKTPAKVTAECRSSRCRLTLDGATADVSKTIAALETTKGLLQFADSLYLTRPTQRDDGTMQLQAIATFTR